MGVFSWECNICHRSILCMDVTSERNAWMHRAVCVFENDPEFPLKGQYDGYGRMWDPSMCEDDQEFMDSGNFSLYHLACWRLSGKPGYTGASRSAADQGYFVDDEEYDLKEPKEKEEIPVLTERKLSPLQRAMQKTVPGPDGIS